MTDTHATRLLNVSAIASRLNPDELEALEYIATKLAQGIVRHGHLNLSTDRRDWLDEARQEYADGALYFAFHAITRRRVERGLTELASTPATALNAEDYAAAVASAKGRL